MFGLQNRAKSKEEKRKSQEESAKVVTLVTSAVVVTEDVEATSKPEETAKAASEARSAASTPSVEDGEQPMLNPVVQQLRISTSRLSNRSSSGSLDSPCITPKSSERGAYMSTRL